MYVSYNVTSGNSFGTLSTIGNQLDTKGRMVKPERVGGLMDGDLHVFEVHVRANPGLAFLFFSVCVHHCGDGLLCYY